MLASVKYYCVNIKIEKTMTYPLPCPAVSYKIRVRRMWRETYLATIIVLSGLYAPSAHAISLALPIDCTLGKNCFIQNYPDHDASPEFKSYQCSDALGYNGHDGTDFRLIDEVAMRRGVNVLASASGTVTGVRDSMEDIAITKDTIASVKGKECGNGVVIAHKDGWETQYCHMKQHSILVKQGDEVHDGQPLGQVGLSGLTQFPHVHLSVRNPAKHPIDPFTGEPLTQPCKTRTDLPVTTLWNPTIQPALHYTRGGILKTGFSTHALTYDEIENDAQASTTASSDSPIIAFFTYWYGLEKGDTMTLTLTAPDGEQLNTTTDTLTKNKATYFRFVGRKHGKDAWKNGIYHGQSFITRQGNKILESNSTIRVQ
jgi:hypothetical protein